MDIEYLLNIYDDDFSLWKSSEYGVSYYHVSTEGYVGHDSMEEAVEWFKHFLGGLENYLITEHHEKTPKHRWRLIYSTRAVDVCYEHECYWVFLDGYKSTEIWDTYYYLEDVIKQLEELSEKQKEN